MIISNQQVQNILKLQQMSQRKKTTPTVSSSSSKLDTLELSGRVVEMQFAKEQVLKSPDIRTDKINELKSSINQGSYQVSGKEIASKMISRSLVDELAGR